MPEKMTILVTLLYQAIGPRAMQKQPNSGMRPDYLGDAVVGHKARVPALLDHLLVKL